MQLPDKQIRSLKAEQLLMAPGLAVRGGTRRDVAAWKRRGKGGGGIQMLCGSVAKAVMEIPC